MKSWTLFFIIASIVCNRCEVYAQDCGCGYSIKKVYPEPNFASGIACIIPTSYKDYRAKYPTTTGRPCGLFVTTPDDMENILRCATNECFHTRQLIMGALGIPTDCKDWVQATVFTRLIIPPSDYDQRSLRIPSPKETCGCNSLFVPGGYTKCNVPERICDQLTKIDNIDTLTIHFVEPH